MHHLEKSELKSEERRARALLIGFIEYVASVRYNYFAWYLVNCFPMRTWGAGRAGEGDQNPTSVCCPCHGRETVLVPEQHQEPLFLDGIFICVGFASVSGNLGHLASKFNYFKFLPFFFFVYTLGSFPRRLRLSLIKPSAIFMTLFALEKKNCYSNCII